jgi:hypothetical protein
VRDDFNIDILYEASLADLHLLEEELLRIGSFYIAKSERLCDTEVERAIMSKDRQGVLNDLLELESKFLFKKVQLSQCYMEAYEHICDSVDQQRLMRAVVDLMAKRPRLSLDCLYFRESYKAELESLDAQIALMQAYSKQQVEIEKEANSHVHDSMALGHRLSQLKQSEKWSLVNPDEVVMALVK